MNTVRILGALMITLMPVGEGAVAAENADQDASALAKQVQNPLATLVTLPMQANYNTGVGADDRTFFNLNVQPVIPFPGKKWNVIARTIIPINSVPQGTNESVFGIGDATLSLFFSPAKAGNLTWGIGPIIGLPSASNPEVLGSGKWGAGPTGVLFLQAGKWTMGGLAANVWSFAGDKDRVDYSLLTIQYFINFNLGSGWALGTAPIVTANWEAESGEQWTVPWGLQVSKVTQFGRRPVNLLAGYYYNSVHPTGAAESQIRVQLNLLFPTTAN